MWRLPALVVALVGCASAKIDNGVPGGDGGIKIIDSDNQSIDAPRPIDAPPPVDGALALTLTETGDNTIAVGTSLACADNADNTTRDNNWYRAFQLSDYPAITGGFQITSVTIGVEAATTSQPITVKVGSYSDALGGTTINAASITPLSTGTFTPADTMTGELAMAPLTTPANIPAGGKFVVTIVAPDMDTTGQFFIGGTAAAETHPGYLSSAACSVTAPETTAAIGSTSHIIVNVNGTH